MTKVSILLAMSVLPLSAYAATTALTSPEPNVCVETITISGQMVSVAGK
ncbi:hypothetical protein [Citrobacter braakii]|uniref:Uncharacterized protein n=1 Tax=Citrobacter braakii TaxID=57706 RepID=A0A8I0G3X9_CITBR|nr:hypothetical protein [Citrobacter braakii]HBC8788969.1 hypothetical protein [Citrobacter braakii]HDL3603318.1 hypothetical protein [Citrobacter braakii]